MRVAAPGGMASRWMRMNHSRMCESVATLGAVISSIAGSWPQCCSYSSSSFSYVWSGIPIG